MDCKKNIFSYFLWLVYAAAVCGGILAGAAWLCLKTGYQFAYGFVGSVAMLTAAFLLVFLARKVVARRREKGRKGEFSGIWESLIFVFLVALGLYLRIQYLAGLEGDPRGLEYFQAVQVTAEGAVPRVLHGATGVYLYLLRLFLVFLGNKILVALGLQVGFHLVAAVLLYFAVRKFSGTLSGLVFLGIFMLSPYCISLVAELSPAMGWFLLYGICLCLIASGQAGIKGRALWFGVTGLLAGAVTCLDIFGVTLFLFVLAGVGLEREWPKGFFRRPWGWCVCFLLGAAVGFLGVIWLNAYVGNEVFGNVLISWWGNCRPQSVSDVLTGGAFTACWGMDKMNPWEILVLLGMMSVGIFGFFVRRRQECQGVWIAVTGMLAVALLFGMERYNIGAQLLLYLLCAVLAGVGFGVAFVPAAEKVSEEVSEMEPEEVAEEPAEITTAEKTPAEETPAEQIETKPAVQYIENPLPVPKKHAPRVFDYAITEFSSSDDYDVSVAEEDDYEV